LRYCVLGDVHGNLEALEAVLADAEKQGAECYLCAGDIVGYGANPGECVARVRELTPHIVAGNHDCAVVGRADVEYFNLYAREAVLWTAAHLSDEAKGFLTGLPLTLEVNGFTLVHATVHEPELFGYIESAVAARLSFDALDTELAFVGHSHVPVTFFYEERGEEIWYSQDAEIPLGDFTKTIINVGSVGQPRDDNPHAAYALYDTGQDAVAIRRVPYDIERATQKIVDAGLPDILAARLHIGR
jgi:diadenosine tetraphosphatase ApaH/serine/threonine PP2A family protein phosphatase